MGSTDAGVFDPGEHERAGQDAARKQGVYREPLFKLSPQ